MLSEDSSSIIGYIRCFKCPHKAHPGIFCSDRECECVGF